MNLQLKNNELDYKQIAEEFYHKLSEIELIAGDLLDSPIKKMILHKTAIRHQYLHDISKETKA